MTPAKLARSIVVALWLIAMGCGSSGTKAPDAAGVDAAPDATAVDAAPDVAMDVGDQLDVAPADAAGDSGAGDAFPGDGGGDGAGDPCWPPCYVKLLNGCVPEGACTHSAANYCYANGVKYIAQPPGETIQQLISKNGVLCVSVDLAHNYIDPSGNVLGRVAGNVGGSTTVTCTGEAPVTIPATCNITCASAACTP